MKTLHAKRATILAKPLPEFHELLGSLKGIPSYDWKTPDSMAFAEVVSIGSGDLWGPSSVPPVSVGQVIGFEQVQAESDFLVEGEPDENGDPTTEDRVLLPFAAASVVMTQNPQTGALVIDAIGHWFMTIIDDSASRELSSSKDAPLIIRPGDPDLIPSKAGPPIKIGRIVSAGKGSYVKGGLSYPDCELGELMAFFDTMSSKLTVYGERYTITPWSEALFGVEE